MKAPRILIVEDDFSHRAAMEKVLQLRGYKTCSCESGEHAVPKLREEAFGVLITDFHMHGMDGLQLIREAKKIQPEMSAILMTGFEAMETRVKEREKGVNGFFPKPIEWDELLLFLDTLIREQRKGNRTR